MAATTRTVVVSGDTLAVKYVGSMWVSPHNGQQHPTARKAMTEEVTAYLRSCGESVDHDSPEVAEIVAEME